MPNKEAFKSIGMLDKFEIYHNNKSTDTDILEFYYECLADYIETHLKENENQHIKKRFIVFFNISNQNSSQAEKIIISNKSNGETTVDEKLCTAKKPEYLDIIYGDKLLFLAIGSLSNQPTSIIRIITKEKWFVSKHAQESRQNLSPDKKMTSEKWST